MIVERIFEWARFHPNKAALIHNDVEISYAVFARGIELARGHLASLGPPAGRTAIVLCGPLDEAWTYVLALRALGMHTICVTSLEQAQTLAIGDPAWLVAPDRAPATLGFRPGPFLGARMVLIPSTVFASVRAPAPPPAAPTGPQGGHILFSSGTTGAFKKVFWDARHEGAQLARTARYRGVDRDSVSHALNYAQSTVVGFNHPSAVWAFGGTVILDQRQSRFDRFFDRAPNRAILSPSVLKTLVGAHAAAPRPDPRLAVEISGGFLSWDLYGQLTRVISPRVRVAYAATETPNIASAAVRDKDDLYWLEPSADRLIEIVDDLGAPRAADLSGEVRIRLLDCDPTEYLDDPAATAAHFRDGWFYPGDLGVRRADGRIRVLGRAADVLMAQGDKVAVGPLEETVRAFLGVDTVCLFNGVDGHGRDELVMAIEAAQEPPRDRLNAIAKEFAAFEHVRFAWLTAFPRTAGDGMGKIDRLALRRKVCGG